MEAVQELEHYLSRHTLDALVKDMMVSCLKEKPEEPTQYLLKWILQRNAGKSSEEVAVASVLPASSSKSPTQEQPAEPSQAPVLHLAISHSDRQIQQYLTDKKVHLIFLELLKQVAQERPENPLSFLALQAHNLHKSPPPALAPPQ